MRRIIIGFWFVVGMAACGAAGAAEVRLVDGRTIQGIVISRPDLMRNRFVVTITDPEKFLVFQFLPERIATIKSATDTVQLLKEAAPIRKDPSPEGQVVRNFTPGMELTVLRTQEDWIEVAPVAPGLVEDKGWLRKDQVVKEIIFTTKSGENREK